MFVVRRSTKNPILAPHHERAFEASAAFNPSPVQVGDTTFLFYRAQGAPEQIGESTFSLSTVGKAYGRTNGPFSNQQPFITPEEIWERYGCEDPRVTKLGKNYYIFYTALSSYPFTADSIKVAVAVTPDLKKITAKHLVTPFNAKAMSLFPEKINGKITAILTVNTDRPPAQVAMAQFDREEEMWSPEFWNEWYKELPKHILDIPRYGDDQVEVGASPIKTSEGWLVIYSHIQKYSKPGKIFGIEAVLLDLNNPQKVLSKTVGPIISPEESYEYYGLVPNIVFPSGALLVKDELQIFYGGADTISAYASVNLNDLISGMAPIKDGVLGFRPEESGLIRASQNPILIPEPKNEWETKAVFNPASIELGGKVHILYRAMSDDNTSVIGYASSKDGVTIDERDPIPVYVPRAEFEMKKIPGGNSGCEDPRLTVIGDRVYICYTAYNGVRPPSVALSSITKKDFLARRWNWTFPILITHDGVDDKDGCILPEKIDDKYAIIHRVNNTICIDYSESLEFPNKNAYKNIQILATRSGMWDSEKVGISCTPIRIPEGWLMIYHGVSLHSTYRVGVALLRGDDPTQVLARTTDYILEPQEEYEKSGQVAHVVFPCGAVIRGGELLVYYGGGDSVIAVAKIKMKDLLKTLLGR